MRRLDTKRFQEDGWQEPCESRGSRTVLRGTGGETPPVYPTICHELKEKKIIRYHNAWRIVCGLNTGKKSQVWRFCVLVVSKHKFGFRTKTLFFGNSIVGTKVYTFRYLSIK